MTHVHVSRTCSSAEVIPCSIVFHARGSPPDRGVLTCLEARTLVLHWWSRAIQLAAPLGAIRKQCSNDFPQTSCSLLFLKVRPSSSFPLSS